ncbi:iduronate 2-sulfatase [Parapedobacter composti]|uniref:Iduronate 2-sulfatase n=2 Tax=Parapedobacter composti TaxID=623281 RepID=A0A1I1JVG3_9SPHI|nr:iduronate 2-sulfatase [Parapedobacter composti]
MKLRGKLCLLLGIMLVNAVQMSTKGQQRKNILFLVVDDLRPDIGCYGDQRAYTPNIDKLAERGVVFRNAYCQQAVCSPSRTSMLTGLRPDETGVHDLQVHFRENLPGAVTLPQHFKGNGYFTASVGKIFHNSKRTLDSVSWTEEISPFDGNTYVLPENRSGKGKQRATEMADVPDTAYSDGKIAEDAIRLLAEAGRTDNPFFIAVGFKKPHAPFCAPKRYWDLYERSAFGVVHRERPVGSPELSFHQWQELRGYSDVPDAGPIPPEQEQELIHGYYACISYVDAQIGRLMDELETLGLSDSTIIVLWGDHGYHLGEQDLWCKSTNFELDVRVPLIIAAPGMAGNGSATDAMVESVDIYPTLNELCGIPMAGLSGISLRPLLAQPSMSWDYPAFSQFVRPYPAIHNSKRASHMGYSVRIPGWRCTYWYDLEKNTVAAKELYRLDNGGDMETENIVGKSARSRKAEKRLSYLLNQYRNGQYRKVQN